MPAPISPAPTTRQLARPRAASRALRIARVLLDLLGGEEDGHQRARDVGDRQLAEAPGLELQALGQARRRALLDDVDARASGAG